MFQKICEGCGRRFEAQKRNRRWCSDVCGRRTRRNQARGIASGPVIRPVRPVIPLDDPYIHKHTELVAALGTSVPESLLSVLADDEDDDRTDCTEGEFAAVVVAVVAKLDRLARSLQYLADDLIDPRVITYLAKTVPPG